MPDFKTKCNSTESWYDLSEDWTLIESSFAKQYGIRIRQHTDMPWSEFSGLVSGLMADTPLGNIINIRAEKDPQTVKSFTPSQRKIRSDWQKTLANKKLDNPEQLDKEMKALENMFEKMFGGGVQ